ncbi:MAG TPA: cytochrome c biogenesis protein CcsA [Anaeromyxobacteraceae bacterium]|nr:cytochrome c biogenesis protein CcsA [Anaeromyxobacteraceae bacterium]
MTTVEIWLIWPALVLFALGFVAELWGMVFGKPRARRVAFWVAAAAFGLETAAIAARWVATGHGPVMRTYENSLAGSWFLFLIFLGVSRGVPRARSLLVGVLPIVLLMVGNGIMSNPEHEPLLPPYQSGWLWIHVAFAWFAYGSFLVAAVLGGLHLWKAKRADAGAAPPRTAPEVAGEGQGAALLPPPAILDELSLKSVIFGFVSHTVMLGAGAIWAHGLWGRYWSWDPVETWSLITWVVYGLYLHLRVTYGWRGRRAAWLAIACAAAVIITFGGMGFTGGVHTRLL